MKWIKVEDGLPGVGIPCLVYAKDDGIQIKTLRVDSHHKDYCWDYYGLDIVDVTHWMPLPELPKQ